MIGLYTVFGMMILSAIVAIELEDLLSSVICVSAVGLGLSIAFLILKAPDAAFTQLVVEILCLIILIRATIKKDVPFSTSGRWYINTSITIVFILIFLAAAAKALRGLPEFGNPVLRVSEIYIRDGLAQTGATNLVAAILQDYRAYDRVGEVAVLFIAYIGVLAILRRVGRKRPGEEAPEEI